MTGEILIPDGGDPFVAVEPPFADLGNVLLEALRILGPLPIAQRVCNQHPSHCMSTTVGNVLVHIDGILGTMMIAEMEVQGDELGDYGKPVLAYLRAFPA
jgi:hypothetical protein